MAFLIGQCCEDEIGGAPAPGSVMEPINDDFDFTNVATVHLLWTAARISKYGRRGGFQVWIVNEDGDYVIMNVQAIPDNPANPSYYDFDFGGLSTGWIEIF